MSGIAARPKVVLFVDDQYLNRALFLRAFSRTPLPKNSISFELVLEDGLALILVNNTAEAVSIFQKRQGSESSAPIDLVFMDRDFSSISPPLREGQEPGGNGDWAIQSIRSLESEMAKTRPVKPCVINYNTTDDLLSIPADVRELINSGPNLDPATGKSVKAGSLPGGYKAIIQKLESERSDDVGLVARDLAGLSLAGIVAPPAGAGSGSSSSLDGASPRSKVASVPRSRCSSPFAASTRASPRLVLAPSPLSPLVGSA